MAFVTSYAPPNPTNDSTGWAGYTMRQVIPAALITTSGNQIRLTMKSGSESSDVLAVYIGHRSGSTYNFDGSQVPVTVGASGTFTVGAGASAVSDAITFNLDETKDLILSVAMGSSGSFAQDPSVSGADSAYVAGSDASATTAAGGYTANTPKVSFFILVETQTTGGGTAYTLTAAVGAFALSGVATAQKLSFGSVTGAFALSGQAAGQKLSYTSGAGAFALSGKAAAQKLTYGSATGSFSLSGKAAGQQLSFGSAPGAFTLTGVAANLVYTPVGNTAYTLTAGAGAFALSGVAAAQGLSYGSAAGAFSLSGVASAQKLSYGSAPGAFVVTGNDAALIKTGVTNYTLTADAGAFVLSGKSVADPASNAPIRNTGGWLPESKEARNKRKTRQRKERAAWDAIERDLANAYAKAMGIPQETAEEVVAETLAPRDPEIVRRIAEQLAGSPDPAASQLLKQIEARLASLHGLLAAHVEAQAARMRDEEDAILALLLAA